MSSQLQVSGEAKIRDIQGPVVANSGVITALDGAASQYVRGDGTLADFPTSTGGGSSVSYYLNSSVSQGTIGGVAYRELSKEPIIGAGTDIPISTTGYVASYITDINDPDVLSIPGGNFNCEFYFSVNNNTGNPFFYAELYKYDGTNFTLIGSSVGVPEYINQGTVINPYYFAIAVPTTALALTDRFAIRIYVNVGGRTVTLHTENGHLCQVVTTFSKGMVSLNNLTDQSQNLTTGTSGTNFAIVSSGDTHTFNLPVASAANTGKLSSTDWSTFNNKQPAGDYVTIDTTQTITGNKTFSNPTLNNGGISLQNGSSYSGTGYMNLGGLTDGLRFTSGGGISNYFNLPSSIGYTYTFPAGTGTIALIGDITYPVTSVFGRTGAIIAVSGDYNTDLVTEGTTNLYFTNTRSRATLSFSAGSGAYNNTTGVITIPTNNNQITNGASYITLASLSAGAGISYNNTTGAISSTITQYTDALARASISLTTTGTSGPASYNSTTGVLNIPDYVGGITSVSGTAPISVSTVSGAATVSIATASTTVTGALTSTDWNTFNGKQASLNGTGFVKATGTTISYDNNTYLTTTAASNTYLPLAGGTLTGQTLVSYAMGADDGFIVRHSNLTQGISIGFNTIKASGSIADQNLSFYSKGIGIINLVSNTQINGTLNTLTTSSFGGNLTTTGIGKFWDGTQGLTIGAYPTGAGYGAIYLASVTPTTSNYSIAFSSTESVISVPTGGSISLCVEASAKLRINTNGYVRIGAVASTANERLDVDGAVQVRSDSQGYNTTTSVGMLDFYAGYTRLLSFGANASTYGGFEFYAAKQNNGNGYTALRMFPSGNLSINNTTDSGYKLDVTGTGRFSGDTILGGGSTIFGTTGSKFYIYAAFSTNLNLLQNYNGSAYTTEEHRASDYSFKIGTTSTFTIGSSGGSTFSSLAGAGSRIVGTDSNGLLSGITVGSGLSLSGGTLTATGGSAGTVTGSGANSQVSFWTSTSNIGGSSSFVWDNTNGRLGIGFQGPAKLYVGAGVNNTAPDVSTIAQLIAPRATIAYPLTVSAAGQGVTNDEIRITFNYGSTFSSTAYIASYLDNAGSAATGLTFGTYNGGVVQSMRLTAEGNLLIGTNTNAGYKLYVSGTIGSTGGFFDASDKRLKTLIADNYQTKGIENVSAKLYVKNGKEELGYYAQELQEILPSSVNEGEDGFLSLSYSQVHTAKIAYLEKEIAELKELIKTLL